MEIVDGFAAGFEEGSDIVGPPEGGEDVDKRFVGAGGDVRFGDKHRNSGRETVIAPHLKDVGCQLCFVVQIAPFDQAILQRIVFEGNEGKIGQMLMGFQVVEKAAHPRNFALGVRPYLDVFIYAFEDGASQL